MELVKRNSAEFKSVKEAFDDLKNVKSRKRSVLLYSLKPSSCLDDMVLISGKGAGSEVVYDLNYETIRDYLRDPGKKLFRKGSKPFYVFKSSSASKWMEFPFEFRGDLGKRIFPLKKVE